MWSLVDTLRGRTRDWCSIPAAPGKPLRGAEPIARPVELLVRGLASSARLDVQNVGAYSEEQDASVETAPSPFRHPLEQKRDQHVREK